MLWLVDVVAILIGLAVCFWGYRLFRAWLAVAGFLLGAVLGYYLGGLLFSAEFSQIISAAVAGVLFACLAYFLYRLGAVLAGAYLGAVLFSLLMTAANVQVTWWLYLIGAVIGGIIAGTFLKQFIIIGSSFQGAYLAVAGIYSVAVSKHLLFVQYTGNALAYIFPWFVYLAIVLLTVAGIVVQSGINKDRQIPV